MNNENIFEIAVNKVMSDILDAPVFLFNQGEQPYKNFHSNPLLYVAILYYTINGHNLKLKRN